MINKEPFLMIKKYLLSFSLLALLLLLSGCVQDNMKLPSYGKSSNNTQDSSWGDNSNDNDPDNIDISDLEENLTESQLGMTEQTEQKMKRLPFPVGEYNALATSGKGTIKGTIYVNSPSGNKVLGGGTRLYLNPVTSYSNQWYNDSYIAGNKMEKADSRLFNYLKFTAADTSGAFAFYGVPSGSYYLIGTVQCGTECGYDTPKSIRIATRVSISGNNIIDQDLSRFVD